jgi:hypothetical protein
VSCAWDNIFIAFNRFRTIFSTNRLLQCRVLIRCTNITSVSIVVELYSCSHTRKRSDTICIVTKMSINTFYYDDLYDTNLKRSYEILLTFHAAVNTSNAEKPYFYLTFNNREKRIRRYFLQISHGMYEDEGHLKCFQSPY